jgi:hypothetical protein
MSFDEYPTLELTALQVMRRVLMFRTYEFPLNISVTSREVKKIFSKMLMLGNSLGNQRKSFRENEFCFTPQGQLTGTTLQDDYMSFGDITGS